MSRPVSRRHRVSDSRRIVPCGGRRRRPRQAIGTTATSMRESSASRVARRAQARGGFASLFAQSGSKPRMMQSASKRGLNSKLCQNVASRRGLCRERRRTVQCSSNCWLNCSNASRHSRLLSSAPRSCGIGREARRRDVGELACGLVVPLGEELERAVTSFGRIVSASRHVAELHRHRVLGALAQHGDESSTGGARVGRGHERRHSG